MDYTTDFEGVVPVVNLRGSLTTIMPAPMPGISEVIVGGYKKVIVDVSEITYLNSSGLSSLINTHRYCHKQGIHMVLARPRPDVMKIIRVARANLFIPIYEDIQSALKDIQYSAGPTIRGGQTKERILIIQKNLQINTDLENILFEARQAVNYELRVETDLEKGLQVLKETQYQLVILDVNLELKEVEGFMATMSMQIELSMVPVLVASPHARFDRAYEFILNGVDDLLPHPFNEFETPTRIRSLMELYYIAKTDASSQQLSGLKLSRSVKASEAGTSSDKSGGLRHGHNN